MQVMSSFHTKSSFSLFLCVWLFLFWRVVRFFSADLMRNENSSCCSLTIDSHLPFFNSSTSFCKPETGKKVNKFTLHCISSSQLYKDSSR